MLRRMMRKPIGGCVGPDRAKIAPTFPNGAFGFVTIYNQLIFASGATITGLSTLILGTLTASTVIAALLQAVSAQIGNLIAESFVAANATIGSLIADSINAGYADITQLVAGTVNATFVTTTGLTTANCVLGNAGFTSLGGSSGTATIGTTANPIPRWSFAAPECMVFVGTINNNVIYVSNASNVFPLNSVAIANYQTSGINSSVFFGTSVGPLYTSNATAYADGSVGNVTKWSSIRSLVYQNLPIVKQLGLFLLQPGTYQMSFTGFFNGSFAGRYSWALIATNGTKLDQCYMPWVTTIVAAENIMTWSRTIVVTTPSYFIIGANGGTARLYMAPGHSELVVTKIF